MTKFHYSGSGKPDETNNWLSDEEVNTILDKLFSKKGIHSNPKEGKQE
jgi:hypothetical protein